MPRERSEIVEIYIQQNKSIVKTQRAFKKLKNVKSAPSKNTMKRLYEKFCICMLVKEMPKDGSISRFVT